MQIGVPVLLLVDCSVCKQSGWVYGWVYGPLNMGAIAGTNIIV